MKLTLSLVDDDGEVHVRREVQTIERKNAAVAFAELSKHLRTYQQKKEEGISFNVWLCSVLAAFGLGMFIIAAVVFSKY